MKIGKIEITNYHQFKDFSVDLTYPKGHAKAGQPLDKVCFIGQSGTGKTSLLNLCRASAAKEFVFPDMTGITITSVFPGPFFREATINQGNLSTTYKEHAFTPPSDKCLNPANYPDKEEFLQTFYQNSTRLIYFPAILSHYSGSVIRVNERNGINDFIGIKPRKNGEFERQELERSFFDFTRENALSLWKTSITKNIKDYRNKELQFNQRVTKALEHGGVEEAEATLQELKAWKQATPNPVVEYAQKLNPLLNEFCLEVNPEFTYESEEDIQFIEIKHKDGVEIPFSGWSTGTLQIIFTATPLLQLNTEKAIILVDEPETSLYPDMQTKIIPFYTQLAPQAQFFFATHSPIIASCFEPWEIVELQFDETGSVVQKKYYDETEERHVENYRTDPRYLRWDVILQKLFDVDEEGNPERLEKLRELATMNIKLKKLKQQGNGKKQELQELWNHYERIAALLGWSIDEKD